MKVQYVVYFTDGSSEMVEIEKPAGAHPDSVCALGEVIKCAEHTGKTVDKTGRSCFFNGKILQPDFSSREDILSKLAFCGG